MIKLDLTFGAIKNSWSYNMYYWRIRIRSYRNILRRTMEVWILTMYAWIIKPPQVLNTWLALELISVWNKQSYQQLWLTTWWNKQGKLVDRYTSFKLALTTITIFLGCTYIVEENQVWWVAPLKKEWTSLREQQGEKELSTAACIST